MKVFANKNTLKKSQTNSNFMAFKYCVFINN